MSDGAADEAGVNDAATSSVYMHRAGTKEYLNDEIMPHLQQALEALAVKIQVERLKMAADVGLEDGQYLPHGWRPFSAHRWLAEYILTHKPPTVAGPTAHDAEGAVEPAEEEQEQSHTHRDSSR